MEIEMNGLRNIVKACQAQAVHRLIYVTSLGVAPDALNTWVRERWKTEQFLLDSGLDVTVIRPGQIVGVGGRGFDMMVSQAKKPVSMNLFGGGRQKMRNIAVDDLVYYLVGVLNDPRAYGQRYDVGCDDLLTNNRMIDITAELLGRKHPFKLDIPRTLLRALAPFIERGRQVAERCNQRRSRWRWNRPGRRPHADTQNPTSTASALSSSGGTGVDFEKLICADGVVRSGSHSRCPQRGQYAIIPKGNSPNANTRRIIDRISDSRQHRFLRGLTGSVGIGAWPAFGRFCRPGSLDRLCIKRIREIPSSWGRRGADNDAPRRLSGGHSSPAGAYRRPIQAHAGRVKRLVKEQHPSFSYTGQMSHLQNYFILANAA